MTTVHSHVDEDLLDTVLRPAHEIASVYIGLGPREPAESDVGWSPRWHSIVERLRHAGADVDTIAAISDVVSTASSTRAAPGTTRLAVFATRGRVLAAYHLAGMDEPDDARYDAPAHVLPLLAWSQERLPHVLVVTDRAGADIEAFPGAGESAERWSVGGSDDEIERNAPGGWAQGRYQHRAEDSWQHNAAQVARVVTHAVQRVGARLLIVSGDVRAVQLLRDRLPSSVRQGVAIRQISGSRSADGSQASRPRVVADLARAAAESALDELTARFVEQRAPGGLAVEGARATVAALAEGRLETLLVVRHGDDARAAWFGPDPSDVQLDVEPPPQWSDARRGPLHDVAVRSALLTGAHVRVLTSGGTNPPAEGIGGICRFHRATLS